MANDLVKQLELLMAAATKAIANKDYQVDVPAPTGCDPKLSVDLKVSQKDRNDSVLSRAAFDVHGQLYIKDTVMLSNGDMKEKWKQANKALRAE